MRKSALVAAIVTGVGLVYYGLSKAKSQIAVAGSRFGNDVLARAQQDLGITETNDPARVNQMLANYGIYQPANWCAVAVGTWIREASADDNVQPPIPGSAGAKATMQQFQDASNNKVGWLDADTLRADPSRVQPGMIAVWQRGPNGSWMGHTGLIMSSDGTGNFTSIEGNSGPTGGAVTQSAHNLSSTALLGMGYFNDAAIFASSVGVAGPSESTVLRFDNGASVNAEIFRSKQDLAQGLMYRTALAADHGALFDFGRTTIHSLWMKNTLLPLDMIFIDSEGKVVGIIENAQPLDESIRSVNFPSRYALEVNGGWVRQHGVAIGMHVSTPKFQGLGYAEIPPGIKTFAPKRGIHPLEYRTLQ